MNIDQAWYRYNNEPSFNQLVKTLYSLMHKMQFTHGDIRNAAFLAAVQIESDRIPTSLKPEWYKEDTDGKY
jgi:hypothetical protein